MHHLMSERNRLVCHPLKINWKWAVPFVQANLHSPLTLCLSLAYTLAQATVPKPNLASWHYIKLVIKVFCWRCWMLWEM